MRFLLIIASIFIPLVSTAASNYFVNVSFFGLSKMGNFISLLPSERKIYKSDLDCFQPMELSCRENVSIQNELNPIDTEHRINSVADVNFVKVLDTVVIDSLYRMIGEFEIKTEEAIILRTTDVRAREKIKARSIKKAQQIAAIMGGELVHSYKYKYSGGGYYYPSYRIGFSSQTNFRVVPNVLLLNVKLYSKFNSSIEEALGLLKDTNNFEVICEYFLRKGRVKLSSSVMANEMHIDSINMLGGLVYLYGRMTGTRNVNCFRLVSMNEKYFYLYYTRKERHYQIQVRR